MYFHYRAEHAKIYWLYQKIVQTKVSMFGGAYGDARMPNWPHWHRAPPCPGSPLRACFETKGGVEPYLTTPYILPYALPYLMPYLTPYFTLPYTLL